MRTTKADPIIAEVRAIRDEHAARFDYDIDAIFRDIRAAQEMYFINSNEEETHQSATVPTEPSLMEWTPPDPRRQNGLGRKSARRVRSPLIRRTLVPGGGRPLHRYGA